MLTKTVECDYVNGIRTLEKTTNIEYDNYLHVASETIVGSDQKNHTTEYKYPYHFASQDSTYHRMIGLNILSKRIERIEKQDSEILQSIRTNYYNPTGLLFVPQNVVLNVGDSSFVKLTYNSYDNNGNVTQYTGADGLVTTLFWAYNHTYPVAKIVGTSALTVDQSLRNSINNHAYHGTDTMAQVDADITFLTGQLSSYIGNNNYQVTLYTYKPLVGMTSETNPNGVATYYVYDSFGRLSEIKDADKRLLKKYTYNYANN